MREITSPALQEQATLPPFSTRLLKWHARDGRKDLPWQRNVSAYRVWVSEVMLQQTQVQTVIPYYRRFIQRFPSLKSLAEAPLSEVITHWAGLGYYARARNLHRTAGLIRKQHGGRFPKDINTLMTLPGIGRSTAGAILVLAYNQRHAILDGNVKRVLARHADIGGWPGKVAVNRTLWQQAERYLPHYEIAQYTQALMDLGAMICTKTNPQCEVCPVSEDCLARHAGRIAERPQPPPAKIKPQRHVFMLMAICKDELLLERRPTSGIWGGLLSFPEMRSEAEAKAWCQRRLGPIHRMRCLPSFKHQFTHFSLTITPLETRLTKIYPQISEENGLVWCKLLSSIGGVPAPVKKLIIQLKNSRKHNVS